MHLASQQTTVLVQAKGGTHPVKRNRSTSISNNILCNRKLCIAHFYTLTQFREVMTLSLQNFRTVVLSCYLFNQETKQELDWDLVFVMGLAKSHVQSPLKMVNWTFFANDPQLILLIFCQYGILQVFHSLYTALVPFIQQLYRISYIVSADFPVQGLAVKVAIIRYFLKCPVIVKNQKNKINCANLS